MLDPENTKFNRFLAPSYPYAVQKITSRDSMSDESLRVVDSRRVSSEGSHHQGLLEQTVPKLTLNKNMAKIVIPSGDQEQWSESESTNSREDLQPNDARKQRSRSGYIELASALPP